MKPKKQTALDTIADVEASGLWPGKVVTEVAPVGDFWEAEPSIRIISNVTRMVTLPFPRPNWVLPKR
jgi:peptide-methionine (S)-S-oxide reductase